VAVSSATEHLDLPGDLDLATLEEIERRVLWLAVRIVDAANRERDTGDGVKVGGAPGVQRLAGVGDDRPVVRPPRRDRPGRGRSSTRRWPPSPSPEVVRADVTDVRAAVTRLAGHERRRNNIYGPWQSSATTVASSFVHAPAR
jgi:hypothetical protein